MYSYILKVYIFYLLFQLKKGQANMKDLSLICGRPRATDTRRVRAESSDRDHHGAWPWMASVGKPTPEGWKHKCGGTLISSDLVLTTAHCDRGET